MRLSLTAAIIIGLALFAAGWFARQLTAVDPVAMAKVDTLQIAADRVDELNAKRNAVNKPKIGRARARTDTLLTTDTLVRADTVRVLVAAERAACDTALAAKDSTIADNVAVRDSAIDLARNLARRGESRLTLSTVYVLPRGIRKGELIETATYRVTRLWRFNVNAGVGYRF